MRVTGTSSAQSAGWGHTEIQQVLPVNRITGYIELLVTGNSCSHLYWQEEGSFLLNRSSDVSRATGYRGLPVTENYWLQSIAGYREICCAHPYWLETSFKSSADNRFTSYRGFPVTDICW